MAGAVLAPPQVTQWVVIDDGSSDGTWDDLQRLAAADTIFGSRLIGGSRHRVLCFRPSLGNLNLTNRRDLRQRITIEEPLSGLQPESVAKADPTGARICEVSVAYYGRTYAEGKKINWKDGVSAISCIANYGLSRGGKNVKTPCDFAKLMQ